MPRRFDLGYLGTYSDDRQPTLERLLLEPARRLPHLSFVVAGPQFPSSIDWPENVTRFPHVSPDDHALFYGSCRWTLNITRRDMIEAGWSPSVRLFEAAACGTPILSDRWAGIETLFVPGKEIGLAEDGGDIVLALRDVADADRLRMAERARRRILASHTAAHRAEQFEADCEGVRTRVVSLP